MTMHEVATRTVATVFGGSGFLGRYVVKRLLARGYTVRAGGRDPEAAKDLMVSGRVGQLVPLYVNLENEATITRAVSGATFVVNLAGLLAESRPGQFQRVHGEGAGRVAQAAAAAGAKRLVHVSAIGASPASPSLYAQSKAAGEAAVREAFPSATILRPSVMFGQEDSFFNRFGNMAMVSPVMPVISGPTRFQPVYVGDVADAVVAALHEDGPQGQTYELGGPEIWTFRELLAWILQETRRDRRLFDVPPALARLQARIGEVLPGKPLTRDQLAMLERDNVAADGMLGLDALGIVPTPLGLVVPAYLDRYRPGGGKREEMPA